MAFNMMLHYVSDIHTISSTPPKDANSHQRVLLCLEAWWSSPFQGLRYKPLYYKISFCRRLLICLAVRYNQYVQLLTTNILYDKLRPI